MNIPSFDHDPYSDEVGHFPYPYYAKMRAAGPVCWLSRYGVYVSTHDAIVRQSHFKQIIDLCLKSLAILSNTRLAWVLREELASRKRKRDRKPDPEHLERNEMIRAEQKAGKTIGQLAKKYHLTRQRIQQIVREKVSSN